MAADYIDGRPLNEAEKQQVSKWLKDSRPSPWAYSFSDFCTYYFDDSENLLGDRRSGQLAKMQYWQRCKEVDEAVKEYFSVLENAEKYFPTLASFCVADQALISNYIEIGEWDEHDAPKVGELVYNDGGEVWAGKAQVEGWVRSYQHDPHDYLHEYIICNVLDMQEAFS